MKKLKIPRSLVLLIVFFIMFSNLIVRLFQLQIVKGQEYENNFILQTKREIVLSGARGNIYDRNGKPLATNKLANSVTFEDQETYNSDRERQLNLNSKIYQMIRIIKSKGDSIETSLKIIIDPNGNFQFSVDDFWLQRFKADVYGKANIDDMEAKERNSTADEIVSYLSDKFCVFAQGEKKYTDKEKDNLSKFSSNIFTLNTFYTAHKRIIKIIGDDKNSEKFIYDFWCNVVNNMREWNEMDRGELSKKSLREDYIITQGLIILSLGRLCEFFCQNKYIDKGKALKKLKQIDWLRNNETCWMNRAIKPNGKINRNEQGIFLTYIQIKRLIGLPITDEESKKERIAIG